MSSAIGLHLFIVVSVAHTAYMQLHPQLGCTYLNNAFQSFCAGEVEHVIPTTLQGPPGKRGVIGEKGGKGERGISGPVAEVNYTLVEIKIKELVQHALQSHVLALATANDRIKQIEEREGFCPVKYIGQCFWMEVRRARIAYAQGQTICESLGGTPANIYSEAHYDMIIRYARTLISPSDANIIGGWIGLKYVEKSQSASFFNGTASPFVRWHQGYPNLENSYSMAIDIRLPSDAPHQGMWNGKETWTSYGVICEK